MCNNNLYKNIKFKHEWDIIYVAGHVYMDTRYVYYRQLKHLYVRLEMFLTCKHLAIIDLILEVFVNDSSSSAHLATLPATSCILHFVVSTV